VATESNDQMGHEPDLNRLAALVDGRLAAAERQPLLAHLAGCRECRDVLALLAGAQPETAAERGWWQRPALWLPIAATLAVGAIAVSLLAPGRSRLGPEAPPAAPARTGGDRVLPPERPIPPAREPAGASPPSSAPAPPDDLLRSRSGTRRVGTKTFQLVAGEWIDASYDPGALLPVVDVASDAARRDVLARLPALAPYGAIADRVTVVHDGTVYRFDIQPR
jgi:hypothetical protein